MFLKNSKKTDRASSDPHLDRCGNFFMHFDVFNGLIHLYHHFRPVLHRVMKMPVIAKMPGRKHSNKHT